MSSSEGLKDIGKSLDVTEEDIREMKKRASKQRLMHIAKLGLPILSFILGLLVGRMANPPSTINDSYPFLGAAGVQTAPRTHRRLTWTATIVLSVVLYVFGLLLYESMAQNDFGMVTLYGTHSRQLNVQMRR
jgi:hypothetical protein